MDPETEENLEPVEEAPAEVAEVPVEQTVHKYVAYHQPKEDGVIDTEINASIGKDIYVLLATILNKLDNIEKSIG